MIRKGRVARLARLGSMAAGLAADAAGAVAHRVHETAEEATARLHRQAAERMLAAFSEMKGLPLKAGQMLSYVDEFVPEENRAVYERVLGTLQANTPPLDLPEIEALFAEDFGGRTPDEVFATFDPEPIAAASIGQVYRATTAGGDAVVVKIQYPGIRAAMDSDLANAGSLVAILSAVIPKVDFTLMLSDILGRVRDECDYGLELQSQELFRSLWINDPEVRVARAHPELSTSRVLVSEYVDGLGWHEILDQSTPEQRSAWGVVIFRFVFGSLLRHGLFNGDPHPGNYLFHEDGGVTFLDFGCVQRFTDDQADAFQALRAAVLDGADDATFRRLMRRALTMPDDADETMVDHFEQYLRLIFQPVTDPQPYRFTRDYSKQLLAMTMELKALMGKRMLRGKKAYPLDLESGDGSVAFLGRIVFGLASILATLEAEADFRAMARGWGA